MRLARQRGIASPARARLRQRLRGRADRFFAARAATGARVLGCISVAASRRLEQDSQRMEHHLVASRRAHRTHAEAHVAGGSLGHGHAREDVAGGAHEGRVRIDRDVAGARATGHAINLEHPHPTGIARQVLNLHDRRTALGFSLAQQPTRRVEEYDELGAARVGR